jgi:hypothetical protein
VKAGVGRVRRSLGTAIGIVVTVVVLACAAGARPATGVTLSAPTRPPGRVVLDYLHALARGDFAAACGDFTESLRSELIHAAHSAGVKATTCSGVVRAGWLEASAGHRRQLDTILDHATIERTTIAGNRATVVARVATLGSSRESSTKVALARVSGVWKITSNHGSGAPGA